VSNKTNFTITSSVQKLQDDLHMLGMKIKEHEENIKFLQTQKIKLDDSILDLQGIIIFLFSIDVTNVNQIHLSK
jgi:hypothetical protein